jgi:hypothetical protein
MGGETSKQVISKKLKKYYVNLSYLSYLYNPDKNAKLLIFGETHNYGNVIKNNYKNTIVDIINNIQQSDDMKQIKNVYLFREEPNYVDSRFIELNDIKSNSGNVLHYYNDALRYFGVLGIVEDISAELSSKNFNTEEYMQSLINYSDLILYLFNFPSNLLKLISNISSGVRNLILKNKNGDFTSTQNLALSDIDKNTNIKNTISYYIQSELQTNVEKLEHELLNYIEEYLDWVLDDFSEKINNEHGNVIKELFDLIYESSLVESNDSIDINQSCIKSEKFLKILELISLDFNSIKTEEYVKSIIEEYAYYINIVKNITDTKIRQVKINLVIDIFSESVYHFISDALMFLHEIRFVPRLHNILESNGSDNIYMSFCGFAHVQSQVQLLNVYGWQLVDTASYKKQDQVINLLKKCTTGCRKQKYQVAVMYDPEKINVDVDYNFEDYILENQYAEYENLLKEDMYRVINKYLDSMRIPYEKLYEGGNECKEIYKILVLFSILLVILLVYLIYDLFQNSMININITATII